MVYSLVQQKVDINIKLKSVEIYATKLADIFHQAQKNGYKKLHIVLVGHQYKPDNFSHSVLKFNDRPKAEALIIGAQKAGCYAKMYLVTSCLVGDPENNGAYYEDGDACENCEMAEVYETELYIENWLDNDYPQLNKVSFDESELIAPFATDEDEYIFKESSGYSGNYLPDITYCTITLR